MNNNDLRKGLAIALVVGAIGANVWTLYATRDRKLKVWLPALGSTAAIMVAGAIMPPPPPPPPAAP